MRQYVVCIVISIYNLHIIISCIVMFKVTMHLLTMVPVVYTLDAMTPWLVRESRGSVKIDRFLQELTF